MTYYFLYDKNLIYLSRKKAQIKMQEFFEKRLVFLELLHLLSEILSIFYLYLMNLLIKVGNQEEESCLGN